MIIKIIAYVSIRGFTYYLSSDVEPQPQSKLDATVTISTPDFVSSCKGSPLMLESFGILNHAEMTDFSNLTVSVEKLDRPEI